MFAYATSLETLSDGSYFITTKTAAGEVIYCRRDTIHLVPIPGHRSGISRLVQIISTRLQEKPYSNLAEEVLASIERLVNPLYELRKEEVLGSPQA